MSSARRLALAVLTGFLAYGGTFAAKAGDTADFYAGRQLTLIVPTGPGGGYALYGQILSQYLGKHIPGNPTVVTQYMPGGGGNVAANDLYNVAPKDGTVIASLFSTITVIQALQPTGAYFDAEKFGWIGSIAPMVNAIGIWQKPSPVSYADTKAKQIVIGATGKSADLYIYPQIMNALLGTKFKIVLGYDSSGAILLAMQSGEAQGMAMGLEAWQAMRPEWIENKNVAFMAQSGVRRDPELAEVPTLVELAQTPEDKQVMTLLAAPAVLGRAVAAPPGIPPARLAMLRKAFSDTMKDPEFRNALASRHLGVAPTPGEDIASFIGRAAATPKPLLDRTKKLLGF
jgi:tripartite-type tricarboxylate transporter receptor subunit TctC